MQEKIKNPNNSAHRYGRVLSVGFGDPTKEGKTPVFFKVRTSSKPGKADADHQCVLVTGNKELIDSFKKLGEDAKAFNGLSNEEKSAGAYPVISVDGFLSPVMEEGKKIASDFKVVVTDESSIKIATQASKGPAPEDEFANVNSLNGIIRFVNMDKEGANARPVIEHIQNDREGKKRTFQIDTVVYGSSRSTDAKKFFEALKSGELKAGSPVNVQGQLFKYGDRMQLEVTHGGPALKRAEAQAEAVEVKEEPKKKATSKKAQKAEPAKKEQAAKKAAPKKATPKKAPQVKMV